MSPTAVHPAMSLPRTNSDSPNQKRKEPPNPSGVKPVKKVKRVGPRSDSVPNGDADKDGEGAAKPKRVRTGCLTCRERHLKCDEGMPHCNNCKKSNRTCRRGVRLNFIDTWAERPPTLVTTYGTHDWRVEFLDESREIASEYQGGIQRYKHIKAPDPNPSSAQPLDSAVAFEFPNHGAQVPGMIEQPLSPIQGMMADGYTDQQAQAQAHQANMNSLYDVQPKQDPSPYHSQQVQQIQQQPLSGTTQHSAYPDSGTNNHSGSVASFSNLDASMLEQEPEKERKEFLDNQEETLFMQVFVEEVGLWMDSMDSQKHFSRLLPFHSLSEPMLLNAFLACGARHLTLVNPVYTEEKALHYYDTATRYLLKNLQNPNRDTVICATTAVILNVYEIMSERALQRMNHIAGARALIKECGWNARAQGIGSACFWLNVGLEVLSCLHFNWQVAWDPDDWQVDLDFHRELMNGREEVWTHRMLYIIAKICNFRATMPRETLPTQRDEQIRAQHRHEEWTRLKSMCAAWEAGIPRTMHAVAYLQAYQTSSKSVFPEVWLVKRSTIVARLFFHTAMLLMAQIHPYYYVSNNPEMADMQHRHSQMICGIVAHVKDRGVASVAIRSLAHAAEVLTSRVEQEEVLQIFDKINKETGWRIGFVYKELKEKWGWNEGPSPQEIQQTHTAAKQAQDAQQRQMEEQAQRSASMQLAQGFDFNNRQSIVSMQAQQTTPTQHLQPTPPQPQQKAQSKQKPQRPPAGIPNPLYVKADFNLPQHPYQNFYVPPNNVGFPQQQQGSMYYGQ
ncbi:Transcription factor [Fulvia fulva]|uniref:Transcription factor n=1 Tax=Passalora fulva TaxID=5499 RepID=A0A9Q8PE75_PASFU|nr:Transcription factor [Fulvia fulva]KAK4617755.1 Transcription factor [Fulvia fulva]KAK4619254.1 Transcription factor [Fulvia fulva]UJO20835.1 Transcription factor [Fulvia fulva]WPV17986.1 Transcription factor [Fulvia fulva]WPV33216.1 Transcription factor [Fulvia fulva]